MRITARISTKAIRPNVIQPNNLPAFAFLLSPSFLVAVDPVTMAIIAATREPNIT